MIRIRPYKASDVDTILSWCQDENTVKPRKCLRRKASSDRSDEFTTNLLLWEKLAALRNSQLNKFNIPPAGL